MIFCMLNPLVFTAFSWTTFLFKSSLYHTFWDNWWKFPIIMSLYKNPIAKTSNLEDQVLSNTLPLPVVLPYWNKIQTPTCVKEQRMNEWMNKPVFCSSPVPGIRHWLCLFHPNRFVVPPILFCASWTSYHTLPSFVINIIIWLPIRFLYSYYLIHSDTIIPLTIS